MTERRRNKKKTNALKMKTKALRIDAYTVRYVHLYTYIDCHRDALVAYASDCC